MRAVVFDMADPEFPASLAEIPEPELPGPSWARVEVTTGGICGSDLHLFAHNTGPSPTLASIGTFPFVLGHETAGRVVEAGANCSVAVGTRVVIDPCIPCLPRGIDPPCANCARGWTSSCLNLDSRIVSSGRSLGFTQDLGGGWADGVLAHDSMLHPMPDAIEDRGASLYEPVSIACHGLMRATPVDGEPVLIVGAGIIGLGLPRRAARALSPLPGHGAGPPPAPGRGGQRRAGRTTSCYCDPDNGHWEELASLSGARVVGRKRHQMLMGGFPYVIEAVGSPGSVTEALRAVAHRGSVLLLGAAGISEVDLTPIWYKEAALIGSIDHTVDAHSSPGLAGGPDRHSVDRALDVLAAGLLPRLPSS